MKFRRTTASLALVLSGALLLGACTSPDETTETPAAGGETTAATTEAAEPTEGETTEAGTPAEGPGAANTAGCIQDVGITSTAAGQISFTAGPGKWSGYNSITSRTYSTYNNVIASQMASGFVYFGSDGTVCENTEFGSLKVLSEDPLEVEYTISDAAKWSDGTPVTINDYLLDWAAQNPEFLAPGYASGEDPDASAVFDHVSSQFAGDALEGPQGEVGGKTFTVKFRVLNPDWKLIVGSALPSHIVAQKAGLEPDALAQAIVDRDAETVKKAADFWNNGWIYNEGDLPDLADVPSSGPYKIKENGWIAGNSLTLTANENYWGAPAGTQDLVFRFIEDAQMAQSLQNGDVQVIAPQPTVDTATQLAALGDAVTVGTYATLTWEHLDFNFRNKEGSFTYKETDEEGNETGKDITLETKPSVFADGEGLGGIKLREAFAYCVPRQTIVDQLIKPIDPTATIMNAREVFPFMDNYDEIVAASEGNRYDAVDIEKAKALVAETGLATPIDVRIGYRAGNQRRTDTVAAIQSSCKDAGFNVIDASDIAFFDVALPAGDYEVALFAWAGSGQIASGQNIYASNKPQNYGQYTNATVDAAWDTLASTLDTGEQQEQLKVIEKELWDTLYGIPLYAHPGLSAWESNIENVRTTSGQDGISWNAAQWVIK